MKECTNVSLFLFYNKVSQGEMNIKELVMMSAKNKLKVYNNEYNILIQKY